MNFLHQLEGPDLKFPSLHDEADVRPLGFHPLSVTQPATQWFAAPSPDGSGDFTPFKMNQTQKPPDYRRRTGSNDEGSEGQ